MIASASVDAADDLKRPDGLSEAQWEQLRAVDAKAADVHDLTAAFVQQKHTPLLLEALESSGLQGRGGAGFSAGFKWKAVRREAEPVRYVVLNADASWALRNLVPERLRRGWRDRDLDATS